MSTNHRERIERVVDKALKEKALGEPYGFSVAGQSIWPIHDEQGNPTGEVAPGWFIAVTIRATGLGEPDLGQGFPVYGIMPEDVHFINVAQRLFDRCIEERQKKDTADTLAAAAADWAKADKS